MKKIFANPALRNKLIGLIVIVVFAGGIFYKFSYLKGNNSDIRYQTAIAEKGILVTSVSASGTITSGNSISINTKVSGEVKNVYVSNGDNVIKGQKIAQIEADEYAKQREAAAWLAYLDALEAVKTAQKSKSSADLEMWKARKAIIDAEKDVEYMNNHKGENPETKKPYTIEEETILVKSLQEAKDAFTASELAYKNANAEIAAAQAKVGSSYRDYQENSSIIYAPATGIISDLSLAPGIIINASSSTSSSTGATIIASQSVGKISSPKGELIATVNLAEVDVVKVKAGQQATLTIDAYPEKTFTGKVLAVNTAGSVSSGVTTYPVSILLDPVSDEIYLNMSVTAEIITNIVKDAIIIPSAAVTTTDGQSTVQIKKGEEIINVAVEIGSSNDSQTEIISGINEGDEVVTGIVNNNESSAKENSISPFNGLGRSSGSSGSRSSGGNIRFMGPLGGF